MRVLYLMLLIVAAVFFAVALISPPQLTRINLIAAGLLAWVLVPLIQTADRLGD